MAFESAPIHAVYVHPTAETSPPSRAAAGSNLVEATMSGAGWTTIRSVDEGYDISLGEGEVKVDRLDESSQFKAPLAQANEHEVVRGNGYSGVSIPVYGNNLTILALDSMITTDSESAVPNTTKTYRTVVVEYDGLDFRYFPKVRLQANQKGGAVDSVIECDLVGKCMKTASYPAAGKEYFYV
jgi:hypothetical protein